MLSSQLATTVEKYISYVKWELHTSVQLEFFQNVSDSINQHLPGYGTRNHGDLDKTPRRMSVRAS